MLAVRLLEEGLVFVGASDVFCRSAWFGGRPIFADHSSPNAEATQTWA